MNPMRDYYEKYWTGELGWRPPNALYPETVRVLINWVPPQSSILDLGCGEGATYATALLETAKCYKGVDLSEAAVERARERGVDAISHDLSQPLPFETGAFEVVICIEVLEQLFAPATVVAEAARTLRAGGILIVGIPNAAFFLDRLRLLTGKFEAGGSVATVGKPWEDPHIRFFTEGSIRKLLQTCGLKIEKVIGLRHPMLAALPIISPVLAKVVGGYKRLSRFKTPLDNIAQVYPRLFARHLMICASKTDR